MVYNHVEAGMHNALKKSMHFCQSPDAKSEKGGSEL